MGYSSQSLARVAYTAYGLTTDWKNYQGAPMPAWEQLPAAIQAAWRNAARASFSVAISQMIAAGQVLMRDVADESPAASVASDGEPATAPPESPP